MYKKAIYKYSRYCGTYTEKEKVVNDFLEDLSIAPPDNVRENKTRVFVFFNDGKYSCLYTLPLAYKKYTNTEE